MHRPRAILYDHDGTLVDSIPVVIAATNAVLTTRGFPARSDHEIIKGMAFPTRPRLALHSGVGDEAELAVMAEEFYARAVVLVERARAYDGIMELLHRVQGLGLDQGLVSNNQGIFVRACLPRVGLDGFFARGTVLGEEDMPAPKPDPRGLLQVAAVLGVPPVACWYVGDSAGDAVVARAAGMAAVGVTWGTHDRSELATAGFDVLVDSPAALVGLVEAALER